LLKSDSTMSDYGAMRLIRPTTRSDLRSGDL
jgi:hypothetical protein